MGNGTHGQMGILVNAEDRDEAPWGMGHMRDGAHEQWGTWVMGHTAIIMHRSGWGTWVIGCMGNRPHEQWST